MGYEPIDFRDVLQHLHGSRRGGRLALLSLQTKVEKFVLAEIVLRPHGAGSGYYFCLEDSCKVFGKRFSISRMDLTVRRIDNNGIPGQIQEWVEAKMCYSDCVARVLTGNRKEAKSVNEYRDLVMKDRQKQITAFENDPNEQLSCTHHSSVCCS